ncbi:gliding motility-associated ABC transporter substrate-binding protein GldG [Fulvivirga sp. 29W222]|uniref:Gliding motility-associated ABC transporter substrate-binding protein GldG n=1 Tax=Fulvivirga marina TaxID=2494733 RepID=A0A937G1U7_9BACT|nr:gliding motility-associated ABC transporter substrate-binding protein GldG [Fulvivirga marina]MBL6448641.1 gliding motility-associated ABC transporter substrate-binding protein GldG [Fulvivirga marina]
MVNLKSRKLESVLRFLIGMVAVLLFNILASSYFHRFDLTEEERYSIKQPTKDMLRELDDVVYVEVYLDGELNSGFKRLQRAIRETLEEFRVYSGDNIQYTFNDPSAAMSEKARGEFMRALMAKGIQPTNIIDEKNGNRVEKLVFPGAIVSYGGVEAGVMLLKGNKAATAEEKLNQSIEGVEYELASTIRGLTSLDRKKIALVKGHNELDSLEMASFATALAELYDLGVENLKTVPTGYDALVIAKPTKAFSEQEKYHLDQYLMNGGKVLMLIDKLQANMDSASAAFNYAFPYELNIDDQLFKYGVRINSDLMMDNSAAGYPVVVGNMGDQPQIKLQNWPFYPIINRFSDHAITRNMDAVLLRFGSTIDTIKTPGVKKTPLMYTSQYTRVVAAPVNVSVQDLRANLTAEKFDKRYLPVAYLLEGRFESLYKNRFKPENIDETNFVERAEEGAKLLVVSDGDIARNEINTRNSTPQPLGFYPFSQNTFANQDFLMNVIAYLIDDEGIITARNKEIKIRPLDKVKVSNEKTTWQVINMVIPVLLLIVYGMLRFYWRKKKYTGFGTEETHAKKEKY